MSWRLTNTIAVQRTRLFTNHLTPRTPSLRMSYTTGTEPAESIATEVLSRRLQNLRVFVLNRPKALNALNLNMVQLMTPQLKAWNESDLSKVILLMGVEGSRGFCAGGDVKDIIQKAQTKKPEEVAKALKFFEDEYKLNHLIGTLKKPFIALMNGITMGGGVGLSVHAPFRIVTENTVFAMPETAIGLFPDVGGSFFLPRLDGELGTYLGLTGYRLTGEEVMYAGVGTHFIPAERIPALLNRLSEIESDEIEVINMALEEFVGDTSLEAWKNWCFKFNTIEEIEEALKAEKSDWANETLKTLMAMSPTSLKVTLQQLRKGRDSHFAQCLQMEYSVVQEFLRTPISLKPVWSPTWDEKSTKLSEKYIEETYFQKKNGSKSTNSRVPKPELEFLNDATYWQRGHRNVELTKNADVVNTFLHNWVVDRALQGPIATADKLPNAITVENGFGRAKSGLKEKIEAYLSSRNSALKN
ncbi:ClpP/crotonase-like domain-containing protein [Chytridium lagenaria]|nr:ClpP/crotonase-like domain-containing protein [Chytridium lagenaria]